LKSKAVSPGIIDCWRLRLGATRRGCPASI
jgi:hypothetical protein